MSKLLDKICILRDIIADKKYDKQGVWILTKTGPKRFNVELGTSDDNVTQIISNEIKEKDKVIISIIGQKGKKPTSAVPRRF